MSTIKVDAITTRSGSGEISLGTTGSQTINRTGNGDLIAFQKGGADSGSISIETNGTAFDGEASHAGLKMFATQIAPRQNGADIDNTIDLGSATVRFKDIFISGGLKVGGTGTANTLDDYEEGTWSPTIVGYGGGNTQTYQFQNGQYTKIGRQVIANYSVRLTAKGNISGSYVHIMNFPFALSSASPAIVGSGVIHYIWSIGTARDNFAWEVGGGTTDRCWLTYTDGTTTSYVNTSDIGNTTGFMGTIIYITDA